MMDENAGEAAFTHISAFLFGLGQDYYEYLLKQTNHFNYEGERTIVYSE